VSTALRLTHDVGLPPAFAGWFATRGWTPRPHQLELLEHARDGRSTLLIAPTGAGKTLAGFLPSLTELAERGAPQRNQRRGVHTLYISPLKALAVDVARNVERPVADMNLPIRVESRTGDTPQAKRQRQKIDPPDILLTTPEQVALLIASREAVDLFGGLRRIIIDELHALAPTKRGDLLALGLARLRSMAPGATITGLSATVANPDDLRRWLVAQSDTHGEVLTGLADLVVVQGGAAPDISIHETGEHLPWSGHAARHALPAVYDEIARHRMTLIFVNTRFVAEFAFQELWRLNTQDLPIALHHGSLDVGQRRRVEAAMAAGQLRAVVATSTLDLGIDWGDIDLVVHVGSPKGSSRLLQRIGRANHRMDEPSKAIIVPGSRFERVECEATRAAALDGEQDTEMLRTGALDVLAQHVLGMAVAEAFDPDALYAEICSAAPYSELPRADFDAVVQYVATGGYALKSYERFAKIRQTKEGLWRVSNPRIAQQYRMNVGTITEAEMLKIRLMRGGKGRGLTGPIGRGGRVLGEVEEGFVNTLSPGDTFVFGGEVLEFHAVQENSAYCSRSNAADPRVPSYAGSKMPFTTGVAARVRRMIADPASWHVFPEQVREWLEIQQQRSIIPAAHELLVETFPRGGRYFLTCYPFEGRLAHQTMGMLLTRRMERAGLRPLGFVATDYAVTVWGMRDVAAWAAQTGNDIDALFDQDMLGDDLEEWLAESSLMKRTFRDCAIIAGLIERNYPGQKKTGRQVTMSSDLVYDVLRRHEPDHILLRAARADAAKGLLDIYRLGDMLARVRGHIVHKALDRVSPLAVPGILEIGREPIYGEAQDALIEEAADELVLEAMGPGH
jgi:ATP-dependent Lhr-like helicase